MDNFDGLADIEIWLDHHAIGLLLVVAMTAVLAAVGRSYTTLLALFMLCRAIRP